MPSWPRPLGDHPNPACGVGWLGPFDGRGFRKGATASGTRICRSNSSGSRTRRGRIHRREWRRPGSAPAQSSAAKTDQIIVIPHRLLCAPSRPSCASNQPSNRPESSFWTATPGAGSGSASPRIALPTRCTYVSHYEENNRSERGNYGFIGRDLISGKVPHILPANCRHRIGADFKCK